MKPEKKIGTTQPTAAQRTFKDNAIVMEELAPPPASSRTRIFRVGRGRNSSRRSSECFRAVSSRRSRRKGANARKRNHERREAPHAKRAYSRRFTPIRFPPKRKIWRERLSDS